MHRKVFLFIIAFLLTQCSSVQYVKKSPDLKKEISNTKRILILTDSKNSTSNEERAMLHDMLRQEISHHSLFIVYKTPPKFKNSCSKDFPNIEGILVAELKETPAGEKTQFDLTGSLINCSINRHIWEAKVVDKFSLEANESLSLVKAYTEKYGQKVSKKVNAYFQLVKDLVGELEGPVKLSEEEELEKIEVESE